MKTALPQKLAILATATLAGIAPLTLPILPNTTSIAQAQQLFAETSVNQSNFAVVAEPLGGSYTLRIFEQIPGKKQCWSESGTNPVIINPLLQNFDYTGQCKVQKDANGYSIRVDGEDKGNNYILVLSQKDQDLLLLGRPGLGSGGKTMIIGRANGTASGQYLKIKLEPGWKLSQRTYQGKPLGHIYFSGTGTQIAYLDTTGGTPTTTPPTSGGDTGSSATFADIANDIYRKDIEQALALGFISGFKEDNTFRPQAALTREQMVSMIIEALKTVPDLDVGNIGAATSKPYPDVDQKRWSAAKIEWAKQNKLVKGYPDGSFRPIQPVTRAELMAALKGAIEYAVMQKSGTNIVEETTALFPFTDIAGHWGEPVIKQMSKICNIASPFNEQGDMFYPDSSALRNYAAAATLRAVKCKPLE